MVNYYSGGIVRTDKSAIRMLKRDDGLPMNSGEVVIDEEKIRQFLITNKNFMIMKYKLTDETMTTESGVVLHRIECVTAFSNVEVGEKGGWIEKEENLSQDGDCWVCGNAHVYGDAKVCGDAVINKNGDYIVFKNDW